MDKDGYTLAVYHVILLLYFILTFYSFCNSFYIILLLNTSVQFRLRNDLYCVEWGVKLYSLTHLHPIIVGITI